MEKRVLLYVPKQDELNYRKAILSQPDTMDYNKGYNMSFDGYHKDTGCIDFPESSWTNWYKYWVNNKPNTYYAYIERVSDHQFIGEVNIHKSKELDFYEMGIIIEGKYRKMNYSSLALHQLLEVAFEEYSAFAVHNTFENNRDFAMKIHLNAGFKVSSIEGNRIELLLTRNDYFENKKLL